LTTIRKFVWIYDLQLDSRCADRYPPAHQATPLINTANLRVTGAARRCEHKKPG